MEKSFSSLELSDASRKKLLFSSQNTGDIADLKDEKALSIIEAVKESVSANDEPKEHDEDILKELGELISKSTSEDDEFEELEELEDLEDYEPEELEELEDLDDLGDLDLGDVNGFFKLLFPNAIESQEVSPITPLELEENGQALLDDGLLREQNGDESDLENDGGLEFLPEFNVGSSDGKKKKVKAKKVKKVKTKKAKIQRVKKSRPAKKKKSKLAFISAISLAVALTALAGKYGYEKYQEKTKVSIVYDVEDEKEAVLESSFNAVIKSNSTICDKLNLELKEYLKILYNYDLSIDMYELILNNINEYDFSGVSSVNIETLNVILNGNNNAPLIADQLYNYKNNISVSSNKKFQMLSNVLSFSDSAIANLLEGKDLNTILKLIFDIDDNIDLSTSQISDGDGKNTSIFLDKLKEKSFGNITQSCEVENNIFSPYIKIYENKIGCYLYFDKDTKKGVNEEVYKNELKKYLGQRESTLDYSKVEDRELLYLYANALLDSSNLNTKNMPDLIMNGTLSKYNVFDIYDLMRYMSGNRIDHTKSVYLYGLIIYGEDSLPLLQEINMCLKIDLQDGLISEEVYNSFMSQLLLGIELYAPDMKSEFEDANKKNESIKNLNLDIFGGYSI